MSFFTQTKAYDILNGKLPIVSVEKTTTVQDALKILYDTGFSSLPVSDPAMATYPKFICGFIDLVDILAYLIALSNSGLASDANVLTSTFLSKQVGELTDFSSRDHFKAVLEEDDLLKVINLLAQDGVHRVAIVDILQDIRFMITQTDIIKVIHANLDSLVNVARVSVKDLGVANSNLICVKANQPALESLKIMHANRLSAAPVVDETSGELLATLSVADLKAVARDPTTTGVHTTLSDVGLPTLAFAESHSYRHNPASAPKAIVVSLESTFGDVITLAAQTRVHRVWVVDGNRKPIGVISLTDICRIIAKLHQT